MIRKKIRDHKLRKTINVEGGESMDRHPTKEAQLGHPHGHPR